MKIYTCDKCGKVIKKYTKTQHQAEMPERRYTNGVISQIRGTYDLCDTCIAELRAWITGETLERIKEE